jgi:hypothetical protein
MRVEKLEKALEKLAVSEKTTLVISKEADDKMRVTSGSWEGEKVFYAIRCSRSAMSSAGSLAGKAVSFPAHRAARTAVHRPMRNRLQGE